MGLVTICRNSSHFCRTRKSSHIRMNNWVCLATILAFITTTVYGDMEFSDHEKINEELDSNTFLSTLRMLMMSPEALEANMPENSRYSRLRNLQKKSKEKHRLLFTRMGRAGDVDMASAISQYLKNPNALSRFRR